MKYYIVSDVHSYYDDLQAVLAQTDFDITNPDHIFVSIGNMLDRGAQPKECLEFLNKIPDDRKILIQGNYDISMNEAFKRGGFVEEDRNNGAIDTAKLITGEESDDAAFDALRANPLFLAYINSLIPYYETENCIFISGWIPCYRIDYYTREGEFYVMEHDWRNVQERQWLESAWYNGMKAWNYGVKERAKTIICGGFPAAWGNYHLHNDGGDLESFNEGENFKGSDKLAPNSSPFVDDGIVCLDGGISYSMQINCIIVEDEPLESFEPKHLLCVKQEFKPKKMDYKGCFGFL